VPKGCAGTPKIAISQQFLTIDPHFVRKKRREKRREEKREREREEKKWKR